MLATFNCGFDTDSKYNTLVEGLIASLTERKSPTSTKEVVMLDVRGRKWAKRACVPPYKRFEATIWSPELQSCISTEDIADIPLAVQ